MKPFLACLAVAAALILNACEFYAGKGGGTETESKVEVAGRPVNPDGSAAVGARVVLLPSDYLTDPVSTTDENDLRHETVTDAQGFFHFKDLPAGSYRIEISGAESGGLIRDFTLSTAGQGLDLPQDTLRPRGGIAGAFAPDSDAQLARFVQVYGMERLVKADPAGNFLIGNLPAGTYEIRCSSLQPFRRDAVLHNIVVKTGQVTQLEEVTLAKEAKLSFRADTAGLQIEGMDAGNPVILDNEIWSNGIEDEYIWAKASLGLLNLRGNVITQDMGGLQKTTIAEQIKKCREDMRYAKLAGMINLVEPVAGAATRLVLPPSGRIEDLQATPSAGSDLIVAEARKATPEKPLIVVVGGPMTTVAQAYLTDPTIATRMVVAGIYSFTINGFDSTANYVVSKKCRFVEWGLGYVWGGTIDTMRVLAIPPSIMGQKIRAQLNGSKTHLSFGDLAPAAYLFNKHVWKSADMVKVSSKMTVQPASDITFDFLSIPLEANDFDLFQDEVLATFSNMDVYKPYSLPATLPAEAYINNAGTSLFALDSAAGTGGVSIPEGAWVEYRVASAVAGKYAMTLQYRSGAGATVAVGLSGQPAPVSVNLAGSAAWSEAADSLSLPSGTAVLRIESKIGKIDLSAIILR